MAHEQEAVRAEAARGQLARGAPRAAVTQAAEPVPRERRYAAGEEERIAHRQPQRTCEGHSARVAAKRNAAKTCEETIDDARVGRVAVLANRMEGGAARSLRHDPMHEAVAGGVAEPLLPVEEPRHARRIGVAVHAARDLAPERLDVHAVTESVLGAPDLRDRLEGHHEEGVGIGHEPRDHVGHATEVLRGDGHRRGGADVEPRRGARRPQHGRELGAERVELRFRRRVPVLAHAPTLRRVDVDADLAQPTLDDQSFEQSRPPTKRIAVGHEHGDQLERAGVAQQLDDLLDRTQRDLAVGELQVAGRPENGAQSPHLGLDRLHGLGGHLVRLLAEVAAAAGEVAARHRPDRGTTAVALSAEHLVRRSERIRQLRPILREQGARLGQDRFGEGGPGGSHGEGQGEASQDRARQGRLHMVRRMRRKAR